MSFSRVPQSAFTIFEIMIVFIVMSVIMGWGLPTYTRTIERARATAAIKNLRLIHAANKLYAAHNYGSNCVDFGICDDLSEINSMNGTDSLSLTDGGLIYQCTSTPDRCIVEDPSVTYRITLTLDSPLSNANPSCTNLGADKICP